VLFVPLRDIALLQKYSIKQHVHNWDLLGDIGSSNDIEQCRSPKRMALILDREQSTNRQPSNEALLICPDCGS
jgi:hypothetical protein